MSERGKSPVLILVILIVIALGLAGGAFFLFQKEHMKNINLTEQLNDLKGKYRITETKLEESKKLLVDFEARFQEAQKQIALLNSEMIDERQAKDEALSQLGRLKMEMEQQKNLRSQLEDKLNRLEEVTKLAQSKLESLEDEKSDLQSQISALEAKKEELEAKINNVQLGKIVVSPDKASAKKKKKEAARAKTKAAGIDSVEGKVLVINKDYNFVVINLGIKDGVNKGDIFSVYSNDKRIGEIKIEKVHDSMSAADFLTNGLVNMISEGDKVIRQKSG